jgi:hypothetical protein
MSDPILRARLSEVALALRPVHKALLVEVQRDYEREHGSVAGPGALLQLASSHPFFGWLHPMSRLMVELDELIDRPEPLVHAEIADLRRRLEALLSDEPGDDDREPGSPGPHDKDASSFGARYVILLQRSTDLVVAHATLRRELARL